MSLLVSFIILGFLYFLKKKHVGFSNRVFIAMILGIAIGAIFKKDALLIEPVGQIYVNLIKMLVIPLVVASIISSITSLEDTTQLKKIGFKTIFWLLATTLIACVIGVITALVINPGEGIKFVKDASFKAREIPTFSKILIDMIPSNSIADAANGKVIPVIISSMLVGIAISIESEKNQALIKPAKDFFKAFAQIMFRITKIVLKLTPYGVFGLMASVSAKYGISTLLPLGKLVLAIYIACIVHMIFTYGSLLAFVVKINPITFFKKIYPAQVVAFTTRSSYGTLPVTIKSLTERVKISEKIANFAAPMGATMGMNGCGGIYPVIVAVFVAKMFNIQFELINYVLLILVTTISSIGTAGVPGTASIMSTVVLSSMGLPVEGIAMVLGVDVIIDMIRTATNVTGASLVSLLVANSEGEFDRTAFHNDESDSLQINA